MSIMSKNSTICIRLIGSKSLIFLGLFALFLDCGIRLVTLRGIRLSIFISLPTLRSLFLVTFPLVPSLRVRGIGCTLLSINMILWRWLLLW